MLYMQENQKPKKENMREVLGNDLYFDLLETEPETRLDKTLLDISTGALPLTMFLSNIAIFRNFLRDAMCTDF